MDVSRRESGGCGGVGVVQPNVGVKRPEVNAYPVLVLVETISDGACGVVRVMRDKKSKVLLCVKTARQGGQFRQMLRHGGDFCVALGETGGEVLWRGSFHQYHV